MSAEMVRVNTRISKDVNDWLDKKSSKTGIPKSTLIYLALEQYIQQQQVSSELPRLMQQLEKINIKDLDQFKEFSKQSL
jgi:antitoxin component of RelBE/YafQ-DinJ toxin-antitoxin module